MDRLTQLQDLRDLLTDSIYEVEPDRRAPLAYQLRATLAEIEELETAARPAADEAFVTPLDSIRRQRAERLKAV